MGLVATVPGMAGFWRSIFTSAFTIPALPATFAAESDPQLVDRLVIEMGGKGVATRVGREEAMSIPAVLRGRNLICSISSLPLIQYGPDRKPARNPLLEQIDPDVANITTLSQTVEDLLFEGIAWWRIIESGWGDFPTSARHVDVASVSLQPPAGRNLAPLPSGVDPRDAVVWVDGVPVPASQMIRFDSPNPGVLKVAGAVIRRAIKFDRAAGMYADDPRPLDFFTTTEGADPADDDEVNELLAKWKKARQAGGTAYVPFSMKYNAVDVMSPADLQLVELQRQVGLEIANALGLDPEDLGISTTSRTYQNAVDRRQDRINDVLMPYMRAIADRLSMGDVTRRGYTVWFDLDDYMRADQVARVNYYREMIAMGAMTVDEVRAEERMPALTSQQKRELTPAPTQAPVAAPAAVAASGDGGVSFSAEPQGATFGFDSESASFAVDVEARTITGLAVPYGPVARNQGGRYRFAQGWARFADIGRVKLLRDHDRTQPLGRAVELDDTPRGLMAKFKISRGKAGDEALALAADGVLDGLSVTADWHDMPDQVVRDPNEPSVWLVKAAKLLEVSLTAMPAFDDSRLTSVRASQHEGNEMTDAIEPQAPAAPAIAPDMSALFSAWAAQNIQNQPVGIQAETRQVVNPTRVAMTSVNEATPYRFDRKGNIQRGSHDFSSDLIAGSQGDKSALDRAETFMRAQFDVDRADVAPANPNRYRPDMYVDQREFKYPLWNAINKGTLADSTPFTFAKFNTASGLVNNHTEGVEPTPGTFTEASQTVTPTAISGKVEITRETWDQGGNPQISNLIWRQMERAWYEALEAAAVAVLDAATPTGITLTTGGGTTGQTLDSELTAAFAALQFIRGGFSMDFMATQIDLYKALVAAKDTTGRRLYPALGPTNASGTVASRFATVDVNGVTAIPSWALAATGIVAASSYLFDSEFVNGWATAPQRLNFQYRVAYVDLAIWGYKATAISDVNAVREVIYDPA
ncbi:phage portal protein [Micromonospora sp. C81]|uniref:phage portal protein n=1 Tax=Micromonospora sp. C81 TaxID=2824881 RepID=UPI001B38471E|nr:phage portal protein [Micromonospora sp. C81]MBQ1039294.1 phage portal protein [Micromonospora sp. C81]